MSYYKKTYHYFLILFLLASKLGFSQAYYHQNTDKKTIKKLVNMNTILTELLVANGAMIGSIEVANSSLKEQIKKDYDPNKYDNTSEFIIAAALKTAMSVSLSLGGTVFTKNKTPYFTANKEKYSDRLLKNVRYLAPLMLLDKSTIRTADRQEIYRIRRDIIRTYSNDERYHRSLLLLAGVAFALENDAVLLNLLKGVEIIF